MASCESETILSDLRSGVPGAFERLYLAYYEVLFKKAKSILADEYKAHDVVQDLFVCLWEKKGDLGIKESLSVYLMKAVKNRCLNQLSSHARTTRNNSKYSQIISGTQDETISAFEENEVYLFNLKMKKVYEASGELSNPQLRAVELIYFGDNSYNESAEKMGISITTFRTHLTRALQKYRKKLVQSFVLIILLSISFFNA